MPSSIWDRTLPICALTLTTVFSILLIASYNVKFVGHPAVWVRNSRDSVAIIVQIIAAIFGLSQSYMLCSLINYAARLRLVGRTTTLDTLGLYTALSIPRIDPSLSAWKILLTGALVIFTNLFSALWAGAITPLTTTRQSQSGNIGVPAYPDGIQPNWSYDNGTGLVDLHCSHTDLVSNCAVFDLSTSLIDSLRTATSPQGPRLHAKLDNATWTYQGRSYGIGVSQGLAAVLDDSTDPYTAYSYFENGYVTDVNCAFNASTNWTLVNTDYGMPTTQIFVAQGSLPQPDAVNSPPYYVTVDFNEQHAVAWTAASIGPKQGSVAVAAIGRYNAINQTQCTVTFYPTMFNVAVNSSSATISVTPHSNVTEFESTGTLVDYIMASFGLLSRISPNVVVSAIGLSLADNGNNYNIAHPGLNSTELTLRTTEASFAAVLDDLLLGEAAAQLALAQVNSTVDVTKDFDAIHFGSLRYIIIALVINSVLIIALLLEATRTRLWHGLPAFNPTNIKHVVAASSSTIAWSRALQPGRYAALVDNLALLRTIKVTLDRRTASLNVMAHGATHGATTMGSPRPASTRKATLNEEDDADADALKVPLIRIG